LIGRNQTRIEAWGRLVSILVQFLSLVLHVYRERERIREGKSAKKNKSLGTLEQEKNQAMKSIVASYKTNLTDD
jgi:hypothetical protein